MFQAVRDVVASYEALIHLFERINFFFQRLNTYTKIPLTEELTELLGKTFTQLLSILAISTKEISDGRMSRSIYSLRLFFANYLSEKVLTRLVGRKDIDDALQQLNMFTNEENLMAITRNLQVSHQVDGNVTAVKEMVRKVDGNVEAIKEVICNVDGHIKATKAFAEDVNGNVKVIQGIACSADRNVKATKHGT